MSNTLYFQKHCSLDELTTKKTRFIVGIHGIIGSFTDQAWNTFVNEELEIPETQFEVKELIQSHTVLESVNNGSVDVGIFAFANSGSGGYLASVEAMGKFNYKLVALFTMPISMCMLVHPDITKIEEIELFFGHPVAVSQCRKTLAERWPQIPIEMATDEMDTALSAKLLAEGKIPKTYAIFASKRAAERYELKVLYEGIHHDPNNATAFAVIKHK
ncbi:MAG: hypothetical protein O3B87_05035 [bacterium]|nr:hypothetical protein [bacterium]